MASKQCKAHDTVNVLLTLQDMTQSTCTVCCSLCMCARTDIYVCVLIHSGNANTPGVPELTATLSHILYNTRDTVAPFAVRTHTHTLLTLAHNPNLSKEIHTSAVCVCGRPGVSVCMCVVSSHICDLLSWEGLSLLFRLRC